jgi:glutaredoxin
VITLYQAEWCPYSSAARQRLTELGVDFVARQVAPRPEDRTEVETIPTLEEEDGTRHEGTDEVFAFLRGLPRGPAERAHRAQYRAHAEARREDVTGSVLADLASLHE